MSDLVEVVGSHDEGAIAGVLRSRLAAGSIYTSAGPGVLVSVNPCKPLARLYDERASREHAAALESAYAREALIYGLAAQAYYDAVSTGRDQAIVLLGESGAGKTEAAKLVLRQCLNMAPGTLPARRESRQRQRILRSQAVLEAFAHAQSYHNPNASRFARYQEVQLNAQGALVGCQTLDYWLEKSRVTAPPKGERNFHVFYALLAGADEDERRAWRLATDPASGAAAFALLAHSTVDVAEDAAAWRDLKRALKSLGLKAKFQRHIAQALVAVLHLGNLSFTEG